MTQTGIPGSVEPVPRFMNVKQVADYLHLNEKKVYALLGDGLIPGTKVTGKWMFPRELIDRWLLESSHGGILADRLVLAGADDPLLGFAVARLTEEVQAAALVSCTPGGVRLGLSLLSQQRVEGCALHWGPASESHLRHPALLRQFPRHHDWILVRLFKREQGLMVHSRHGLDGGGAEDAVNRRLRWGFRQAGSGAQRFLHETLEKVGLLPESLTPIAEAYTEREAAALIAMDRVDIVPGTRATAKQLGLDFIPVGWEAFDLAIQRGIFFRHLFRQLLERLQQDDCRRHAESLGGYDYAKTGKVIWSN